MLPKVSRGVQNGPSCAQYYPKTYPRATKTPAGRPQECPRCIQDRRGLQNCPKSAQEASKTAPRAPKLSPKVSRTARMSLKSTQRTHTRKGPQTLQGATCCPDRCPATFRQANANTRPWFLPLRCAAVLAKHLTIRRTPSSVLRRFRS